MSYTGTQAQSGNQTTIKINTGTVTTPVWTQVGEITEFNQQGAQNKSEDATNLLSTAEEFIPTIPSNGKFAGTMNRVSGDAGQVAIRASYASAPPTLVKYQITLPKATGQSTGGDVITFLAMVEDFNDIGQLKPSGIVRTQFSLKVSGPITLVEGS